MVKKNYKDGVFYKAAVEMWKRKIPIIPVLPRKKNAFLDNWTILATVDAHQIQQWCEQFPNYNAGAVATLDVVTNDGKTYVGKCILDLDAEEVPELIETDTGKKLPRTLIVKTAKGYHYFFNQTDAASIAGNRKVKGIFDFQQNNKYVVAPHSIHPSGVEYTIIDDSPIADLPDWLAQWIQTKQAPDTVNIPGSSPILFDVTDETRKNFETWLGPNGHNVDFTPKEFDAKRRRWPYQINTGCPFSHLHTNPNGSRDFYVYVGTTGYAAKCVHSSCEMGWKKYRAWLEEQDGKKIPFDDSLPMVSTITIGEYNANRARVKAAIAAMGDCPPFPEDILVGSWIGDLTTLITEGTTIPPSIIYNAIKLSLSTLIDGLVGYPTQTGLALNQYTVDIAPPNSGKSFGQAITFLKSQRANRPDGIFYDLLQEMHVGIVSGDFGSGQALVKRLGATYSHQNVIMFFDEMVKFFKTAHIENNTLEETLLNLYQQRNLEYGNMHDAFSIVDVGLNFSGGFTEKMFRDVFHARGLSSGFLSRCVFSLSNPKETGSVDINAILGEHKADFAAFIAAIRERVEALKAPDEVTGCAKNTLVPDMEEGTQELEKSFLEYLNRFDDCYRSRLEDHFRRDLLLRVFFSDEVKITKEQMQKSMDWTLHQLALRKQLFTEESDRPIQTMSIRIANALKEHPLLSLRELLQLCNVERTGDYKAFHEAHRSMLLTKVIRIAGQTRLGTDLFQAVPKDLE